MIEVVGSIHAAVTEGETCARAVQRQHGSAQRHTLVGISVDLAGSELGCTVAVTADLRPALRRLRRGPCPSLFLHRGLEQATYAVVAPLPPSDDPMITDYLVPAFVQTLKRGMGRAARAHDSDSWVAPFLAPGQSCHRSRSREVPRRREIT
jgi:hypothetical protein